MRQLADWGAWAGGRRAQQLGQCEVCRGATVAAVCTLQLLMQFEGIAAYRQLGAACAWIAPVRCGRSGSTKDPATRTGST